MSGNDLHRNNFNLIRLLAATQVLVIHVAHHIGFEGPLVSFVALFPGVPIFFFMSGLLIYGSYDRLGPTQARAFYFNRIVRIYPALIVCTALSLLAVFLTGYFHGRDISPARFVGWIIGQVTFVQFYNPPFMRDFGVGVLNGALWTISVELQFYALVPLLYALLHRRKNIWLTILAGSLAGNIALRIWGDWDAVTWKLFTVSFIPWVWMFLVGFAVASEPALQRRIAGWNGWALFALFVVSMYTIGDVTMNSSNGINPVSVLLLMPLIFKLGLADLGRAGRKFYKTDISYGLYVYHMPIINVVLFATAWGAVTKASVITVASFAMAALSWILVEKPALDLKKRRTPASLAVANVVGAP